MIYTDDCSDAMMKTIKEKTGQDIVKRLDDKTWNVNDALIIIADPSLKLAIINSIDEISLMEIGLLSLLCKPILVTDKSVREYKAVMNTVNWIDTNCNIKDQQNNFIMWYKYTFGDGTDEKNI